MSQLIFEIGVYFKHRGALQDVLALLAAHRATKPGESRGHAAVGDD